MDKNKSIKYGALFSYLYIFINIGIGLVYTPWMLHRIGDSEYGLYSLALSLIALLTIDFGLSWAVSRYITVYHAKNDIEGERKFTGIVLKLYFTIDIILAAVLFILYFFLGRIYGGLSAEELSIFRVIYIMVGIYTVTSFPFQAVSGVFIGKGLLYISKAADLMQRILTTAIMIAVILMGRRIYALVIINITVSLATLLFKIGYLIRHRYINIDLKARDPEMVKGIFGFSIWTTVSSVMNRVMFNLMPSFLGAFTGSLEIAIFSFASTFEGYVSFFATAVRDLLLPNVAEIVNRNDKDELLAFMIKAGRIQLKIMGLIVLGFSVIGKEFMIVYIGERYINVYYLTLMMIVPYTISATQDIAQNAILVNGYVRDRAKLNIISAGTIVVLALILINMIGVIGAGVSIFAGLMLNNALMNMLFRKKLDLDIGAFFRECHLKSLAPIAVSALISIAAVRFLPAASGWGMIIAKAGIITLVYMIVMYLIGLDEFEKGLLRRAFRKVI